MAIHHLPDNRFSRIIRLKTNLHKKNNYSCCFTCFCFSRPPLIATDHEGEQSQALLMNCCGTDILLSPVRALPMSFTIQSLRNNWPLTCWGINISAHRRDLI